MAADFRKRFEFLCHLFDRRPFRVPAHANGEEKISVPLYAASMVAIDRIWKSRDQVARDKNGVRTRLNEALGKGEQYDLIARPEWYSGFQTYGSLQVSASRKYK